MSRYHGYTTQQAQAVLDPKTELIAYGEVDWTQNQGQHNGDVTIADIQLLDVPALCYRTVLRPKKLSEPTFIVLLGGQHLQRIDVNGEHEFRQFTHLQQTDPHNPLHELDAIDLTETFPHVPTTENTISDELLQLCYRAAAKQFRIDISGVTWVRPPVEGVTS